MASYKNIELDDRLIGVIRHMNAVEEYRELLQNLQPGWCWRAAKKSRRRFRWRRGAKP